MRVRFSRNFRPRCACPTSDVQVVDRVGVPCSGERRPLHRQRLCSSVPNHHLNQATRKGTHKTTLNMLTSKHFDAVQLSTLMRLHRPLYTNVPGCQTDLTKYNLRVVSTTLLRPIEVDTYLLRQRRYRKLQNDLIRHQWRAALD